MPDETGGSMDELLAALRAVADPSRLRLLALCSQGEWTVSELAQVLGQSQPRISRHLKLLAEAGLLDRFREGGWVFYRLAQAGAGGADRAHARAACCRTPIRRSRSTCSAWRRLRRARRARGRRYFGDERRALGPRSARSCRRARGRGGAAPAVGAERPADLLDIGTGTGRMLELLAPHVGSGSASTSRARCWRWPAPISTERGSRNCRCATATCTSCRCRTRSFAAVTIHQVLHFADDPAAARRGRARAGAGRPAGRSSTSRRTAIECLRERAGAPPARLRRRRDGDVAGASRARPGAARAACPGRR